MIEDISRQGFLSGFTQRGFRWLAGITAGLIFLTLAGVGVLVREGQAVRVRALEGAI